MMLDFGFYNMDCLQGMKEFPDNYFDIAIVDPPYGININSSIGRRKGEKKSNYAKAYWDQAPPDERYFDELFRVSKNQIIWGGNYFRLPPTKCFVVWRKPDITETLSFSMLEYAWTSFELTSKEWIGVGHTKDRIHATQKPIKLYEWLLNLFAKDGDIILDTHVGSASSLIACHNLRFKYVGFEIDEDIYRKAKDRLDVETAQLTIFDYMNDETE